MCEGAIYTAWLLGRVKELGAALVTRKLNSLEQVRAMSVREQKKAKKKYKREIKQRQEEK